MIKVSVIVPVYNAAAYLERCVTSLLQQTLTDIEILLIDDGSPDACPALCDDWAQRDGRIRVLHKENGGLGFARNSGIEMARGEYIGFVDADDYVDACMFERLYAAAVAHDAPLAMSGLCCEGGIMVAEKDARQYINCFDRETVFEGKAGIDRLMLEISGARPEDAEDSKYGFSSVKNLYRADVIHTRNLRFPSERAVMSEDVFFVLAYLDSIDRAIGIEGAYYHYCRNGASLSKSYRADRFEKCLLLIDKMNRCLEKRMPAETYRLYTDRLLQAYARAACMQEIQFAAQNGLDRKALHARLAAICRSKELQAVLRRYPWRRLPFPQAVFAMTMRFSLIGLQKLLVKIKIRG